METPIKAGRLQIQHHTDGKLKLEFNPLCRKRTTQGFAGGAFRGLRPNLLQRHHLSFRESLLVMFAIMAAELKVTGF